MPTPPTPFIPRASFKELRLERNLTTGEVACSTKVSRTSIERFEAGTRDITTDSFLKLLHFYGYYILTKDEFESFQPKPAESHDLSGISHKRTPKKTIE